MKKGSRAHPRWRLLVGVCFGGKPRTDWEKRIAGAEDKKRDGLSFVSFFFNNKLIYKDGVLGGEEKKNVTKDYLRCHRDRNNVRRVG